MTANKKAQKINGYKVSEISSTQPKLGIIVYVARYILYYIPKMVV